MFSWRWLIKSSDGVVHELHFSQRKQKGKRRFCALIAIDAIDVQGIPAAAGVMNFVVLTAALSSVNCNLYLTSRMLFSLARIIRLIPEI